MSRILAGMIIEDSAYENNDGTNGDANGDDRRDQSSASTLPGYQDPSWKSTNGKPNYTAIEEAMKRELKYFGLWEPNEQEPNWDEQQDDEVSARLRALQKELRKQSILNGARKARLTSTLKDQLAYQEYATILEDLDKQVCFIFCPMNIVLPSAEPEANGDVFYRLSKLTLNEHGTSNPRRRKWYPMVLVLLKRDWELVTRRER